MQLQAVACVATFTSTDEAASNQQHCAGADPWNQCLNGFFPKKGILSIAADVTMLPLFHDHALSLYCCHIFRSILSLVSKSTQVDEVHCQDPDS